MELRELVKAILRGDLLTARQWVADVQRSKLRWETVPYPHDLSGRELTVAAAVAELLAQRAGANPPSRTDAVGAEPTPLVLDPGLDQMPRSYTRARTAGPEPFRKRNLVALPDFLEVA